MKHIHTRICPLCSKKLNQFHNGAYNISYCSEVFFRNGSDWDITIIKTPPRRVSGWKVEEPHYSVIYEGDQMFVQSCIIPPYWIRSTAKEGTSKIYKFPFDNKYYYPPRPDNNLIMEVPIIEPSNYTAEGFSKKIKNLVIFT